MDENRGGTGEGGDLSLGGEQRDGSGGTVVDVHIPGSVRQGHGQGPVIGVENGKNAVIPILHPVAHRFGIAGFHRENAGLNRLPSGLAQTLVGLPEGNETFIIGQGLLIFRAFQGIPANGVHPIRGTVAVAVKFSVALGLGAQDFLSGLEEGHALGQKHEGRRQPVLTNQRLPRGVGVYQGEPVEKGVVVVAGDVVYALLRLTGPVGKSQEAGVQRIFVADCPGDKAGSPAVKDGAPKQIPAGVGEEGNSRGQGGMILGSQLRAGTDGTGVHLPALAVEDHMGMAAFHRLNDLIDGGDVQQSHQVKPEAVNVIFVRPVVYGIHNVFSHHAPLGGGVIAAAGAVAGAPAEISRDNLVEAEAVPVVDVIVYHVHDYAQPGIVDGLHRLLQFPHPAGTVKGVCGVGAFGDVEIHRVIAPVVLGLRAAFIGVAKVKHGQQVDMGHAQLPDVIQTRSMAAPGVGAGFCQTQVLPLILDVRGAVHG